MKTVPIEVCESFTEEITPRSSKALLARMTEHTYHGIERVVLDVSSPGGEIASAMNLYEQLVRRPLNL
jgi:ClpP class serine protease